MGSKLLKTISLMCCLAASSAIRCFTGQSTPMLRTALTSEDCPTNNACFVATLDVSIPATSMTMKMDVGQCLPSRAICDGMTCDAMKSTIDHLFGQIPNMPKITIDGCKTDCCYTDDCNVGSTMAKPPPPMPDITEPSSGPVTCYTGQWTADGQGERQETQCPSLTHTCYIVQMIREINGRSRINRKVEKATGMTMNSGECMEKSICDTAPPCSYLIRSIGGNVGCQMKCCTEDRCNDGENFETLPEVLPKQPPTPPGSNKVCYVGTWGIPEAGLPEATSCGDGDVCAIMEITMEIGEISSTTSTGSCIPEAACDYFTCSSIGDKLDGTSGVKPTGCKTKCCDTDRCNGPNAFDTSAGPDPPLLPEPGPPANNVMCYEGTWVEGAPLPTHTTCGSGEVCSIARIAIDISGTSTTTMTGQCLMQAGCPYFTCSSIVQNMGSITPTSCQVKCCGTNLCNGPTAFGGDTVNPSSPSTPVEVSPGCTPKKKSHDMCCGNRSFNSKPKGCCENGSSSTLFKRKRQGCCNGVVFKKSKQECLDGKIKRIAKKKKKERKDNKSDP